MKFDPTVIEQFAHRLTSHARSILFTYTLIGALTGALLVYYNSPENDGGAATLGIILGTVGFAIARDRAFRLKLAAQTALCQVAIERNTRKAAHASAATTEPETAAA